MKAFAVAFIVGLVALLLIGIQQYRYVDLQGDLTVETKSKQDTIAANKESQTTISTLRAEAQRNAACAGGMKVEDLAFELMADPERIAWTARLALTHKAMSSAVQPV